MTTTVLQEMSGRCSGAGWRPSESPRAAPVMGPSPVPRAEPWARDGVPACQTAWHPFPGCQIAGWRELAQAPAPREAVQLLFSSLGPRPTLDSCPEVLAMLTCPSAPCLLHLAGAYFRKS